MARAFDAKGNPVGLMELDEEDLEDLATFNNVQQNAMMDVTGTHMIKNLNTGKDSQTNFHDHKGGQFATVMNTTNAGKMGISGNHMFDNMTNNGAVMVKPRTFDEKGNPVQLMELDEEDLEDLAAFNQFNNMEGGMASITGQHQFKVMNNAKGGKVMVNDHKDGQFSTFGQTTNAGEMSVSGLHQFDKTTNSGQFIAAPRTFDEKGNPVKMMMMDLATFNNFVNKEGGNVKVTGDHSFKNIKNEKKGNFVFEDHKDGLASKVENMDNAGNASFSGNHAVKNQTNSGSIALIPRKFDKDGKPIKEGLLLDLAQFNNFANAEGGNAQFTGTHAIKNISNAKDGNVKFNDHKGGQFVTVGNASNAKGGNMTVQGMH